MREPWIFAGFGLFFLNFCAFCAFLRLNPNTLANLDFGFEKFKRMPDERVVFE